MLLDIGCKPISELCNRSDFDFDFDFDFELGSLVLLLDELDDFSALDDAFEDAHRHKTKLVARM